MKRVYVLFILILMLLVPAGALADRGPVLGASEDPA